MPVGFEKLGDAVDNEFAENTKFNTRKTKLNSLEKKIPDASTLVPINQCNIDKKNLEKKLDMFQIQKLIKFRIKFLIILNILLLK